MGKVNTKISGGTIKPESKWAEKFQLHHFVLQEDGSLTQVKEGDTVATKDYVLTL